MGLFSFTNVTKSKISSILGVIIILASLVSVFYPGVGWGDAAVGMGVGLGLLALKDPPLSGTATGIVAVVLMVSLVGCATYTRCLDKYGVQASAPSVVEVSDSVQVPVAVTVPPDSLTTQLDIDSLSTAWTTDTVRLIGAGGQVHVDLWKTISKPGTAGQLNVRATVPPRIVHDTITKFVTLYGKCPPAFTLQPKAKEPFYEPYLGYYRTVCAVLVTGFLALVALGWVRRRQ